IPETLPFHDLGIARQQPPECDERAVSRTASVAARRHERRELQIAVARAIDVDAAFLRIGRAVLAKARDAATGADTAMVRDDRVAERTLPLAPPHESVDVVGAEIVFDHPEPEVACVWIARAREC